MNNLYTHFVTLDETSARDRAPRGDIYQKKRIPGSLSPSPPVEKESERRGGGELDLDRVQPPRLPFVVNAFLTSRQVAIPYFKRNTIY